MLEIQLERVTYNKKDPNSYIKSGSIFVCF